MILILAGGAVYAFRNKDTEDLPNTTSNPSPAPVTPPHEEGMGEVMPPPAGQSPSPTTTPPPPVQDDMGDVDVAPPKVFNLTGRNFSFSQSEIRVKKGDRVIINFESTDGIHDWVVDEFNARTDRVSTGQTASVEFIADKTGTFEYYCSVSIHRAAGMKGRLVVE